MGDRAYAKVQAQQKTLIGSSSKSSLLQRTCAYGVSPGIDGLCTECRDKWLTSQSSRGGFEAPSLSAATQGNSPAQENAPSLNSAFDRASHFGHDFSQIPIYPPAAGVIQTQLAINKAGDQYEQEADHIADQVMTMPAHHAISGTLPRIQRFTEQPTGQAAPSSVDQALASPGRPLESTLRQDMEQRFGYDFSRVRVHSSAAAEQSAQDVNAHAYTIGHDLVFGAGKFAPWTQQGRRLIAHELTHVVQQNDGMMVVQRGPASGTNPTSVPANRAAYQRYLETLREVMAKPFTTDPTLSKIIEKLYRDHPEVGSGSTAAAIRKELATGNPTKGTYHLEKGRQMLDSLAKWLENNPEASAGDRATAENLFLDLQQAVDSGYYADIHYSPTPSVTPSGSPGGADPGGAGPGGAGPGGEITVPRGPVTPSGGTARPVTSASGEIKPPTIRPTVGGRIVGGVSTAVNVLGSLHLLNQLRDAFAGRVEIQLKDLDPGDFEVGHEFRGVFLAKEDNGTPWYIDIRVERNIFFVKQFYAVKIYTIA